MKQALPIILAGVIFLGLSCGTKSKSGSIIGKWEYDRMEKASTTSDEDAARMDKDNKNHTIEFFKDGKYVSLRTPTDTTESGTYEVLDDTKKVVTHRDARSDQSDTVMITELTKDKLGVKSAHGDYVYLKRIH